MTVRIHTLPVLRDNYAYIIEADDKNCIIIDPGEAKPVDEFIRNNNLNPVLILNTHHHSDHIAGNAELKARYNIPVVAPQSELDKILTADRGVHESDIIEECGIALYVLETPGHTKGHVAFHCREHNALFSGDTLFSMGCGRLLEGTAGDMFRSLQKIKQLPGQTIVYCGHEYTQANGAFALHVEPDNHDIRARMQEVEYLRSKNMPTIPVKLETELKTNPFLRAHDVARFADLRSQKDTY